MNNWFTFNQNVANQCTKVGSNACLMIKYEDLVLHPESTLRRVIKFLGEEWSDKLLRHQDFIGTDISISKTEWSSHQIVIFLTFLITLWILCRMASILFLIMNLIFIDKADKFKFIKRMGAKVAVKS